MTAAERKRIQMTINTESGIPIWLQLRNRIIFLVTSGYFEPTDRLPTVREAAVDLGINYNTVSKVYQALERDGYILTRRGKGAFASEAYKQNLALQHNEWDALIDDFIRQCRELGMPREEITAMVENRLSESDSAQPPYPSEM